MGIISEKPSWTACFKEAVLYPAIGIGAWFPAIGLGAWIGSGGLQSLSSPRDSGVLVSKSPEPRVGEIVRAHDIEIRLAPSVLGIGRRMPIGRTCVHMCFTDEQGRNMTAVLKAVDHPAQLPPNVRDFDGYKVEGCELRIDAIYPNGNLKVTKL